MKIRKKHFFISLAITVMILLGFLDWLDKSFNYHDILVEFHGLFFDLLVFGIFLTLYENFEKRSDLIEYYNEILIDLRKFHDQKAAFQTFEVFKNLYEQKPKKIKIEEAQLNQNFDFSQFKNLKNISFITSNLKNSKFKNNQIQNSTFLLTRLDNSKFLNVDLENSRISSCNMTNATFENVNLKNVTFTSSISANTIFKNCNFQNADIDNLVVNERNWLEIMKLNGNIGINWGEYSIETNDVVFNGVQHNVLRKKTTHNNGYHK